ncbi:MAG: helix-turn-helix domain-containing protein, partial [Sphingobacterium siyangense]
AATNVKLKEAVEKGKFREDLYYRLNTVPLRVPSLRERPEDINLLFRKFIVDFSEKYRTPGVQLTEDAQNMLRNYSWPGNVRQLKNVAEQIAVLEKERIVDAYTLQNYLPNESRTSLPAVVPSNNGGKEDFSERDLLYKVLFDMKKDMVDLKKLVVELIQKGVDSNTFDQNSPYINQLYQEIEPQLKADPENYNTTPTLTIHSPANPTNVLKNPVAQDEYLQDAQEVEESLSLVDKESDLIKKALKKHRGKRKAAAQELGISERTLYRKIKDLNLD